MSLRCSHGNQIRAIKITKIIAPHLSLRFGENRQQTSTISAISGASFDLYLEGVAAPHQFGYLHRVPVLCCCLPHHILPCPRLAPDVGEAEEGE
jgi:hypothetical protein